MPIRFQKLKTLILSSCLFYTHNFYVSAEEAPMTPEDSQVVPVTLEKLKENLVALSGQFDSTSEAAKKINSIKGILDSSSLPSLPQFRIESIASIIGIGITDKDSLEYKQSLCGILEESKTNPEKLGFNGSPIGLTEAFSRMNEILSCFSKEYASKKFGEPTYTALPNGNSVWARAKFLYNDLKSNTEEKITQAIDEAYVQTKNIMSKKCDSLTFELSMLEDEKCKNWMTGNVSAIKTSIGNLESLSETSPFSFELDRLSERLSELEKGINSISFPMNFILLEQAVPALGKFQGTVVGTSEEPITLLELFQKISLEAKDSPKTLANPTDQDAYNKAFADVKRFDGSTLIVEAYKAFDLIASQVDKSSEDVWEKNVLKAFDFLNYFTVFQKAVSCREEKIEEDIDAIFESLESCSDITTLGGLDGAKTQSFDPLLDASLSAIRNTLGEKTPNTAMEDAVKRMVSSMNFIKGGLLPLSSKPDNSDPIDAKEADLTIIGDTDLTNSTQEIKKRIGRVLTDPKALEKLGDPDRFSLYDSKTLISKLYLVEDSLKKTSSTLKEVYLSQYSTQIDALLEELSTVIDAGDRSVALEKADKKITLLYQSIVENSLSDVSDASALLLPPGEVNIPERLEAITDIEKFKTSSALNESSFVPADIGKIIRVSFYKWPKICAQIKAFPDSQKVLAGDIIQGGASLRNCLNEIRQTFLSEKTLFQIGRKKDTADSDSLIGRMRAKGIDALVKYDELVLVRSLLETCAAINFVKSGENQKTFIEGLDKMIGSSTDTADSLFGLVHSFPKPLSLPVDSESLSEDSTNIIKSIQNGIASITKTLNDAVKKVGGNSLISEGWHDYKEIYRLLLNEKQPKDKEEKLKYQFYSVPLLFKINGIPGTDKKGTLLYLLKAKSVQGDENDSWMFLPLAGVTQPQTSYSVVNFLSRSISECASYLDTPVSEEKPLPDEEPLPDGEPLPDEEPLPEEKPLPEKKLFSSFDKELDALIKATDSSKENLYALNSSFFSLIESIIKTDQNGTSTISGKAAEAPLSTDGKKMETALTIMDLDPGKRGNSEEPENPTELSVLSKRVNLVMKSIGEAKTGYFPIRFKEILQSLSEIQNDLDLLGSNIPASVADVSLEQKGKIRLYLGLGEQESLASKSIFGCLNNILKECGAQLLINLIGDNNGIEEDTLIKIIMEKNSEASSPSSRENIQKGIKSLRELSGRIKASYGTFLDKTGVTFGDVANKISSLKSTLISSDVDNFPDITSQVQEIFKTA